MKQDRREDDAGEREADRFEVRFHEGLASKLGTTGVVFAAIGGFFFYRSGFNLLSCALVAVALTFIAKAMDHSRKAAKARARVRESQEDDAAAQRSRARRRAYAKERMPAGERTDFLVAAAHRIDGMSFGVLFVGPTHVHRFVDPLPPKGEARLFGDLAAAQDAGEAEEIVSAAAQSPDAGYVKSLDRAAVHLQFEGDTLVLRAGGSEDRIELSERAREHFRRVLRESPHPYRGA